MDFNHPLAGIDLRHRSLMTPRVDGGATHQDVNTRWTRSKFSLDGPVF